MTSSEELRELERCFHEVVDLPPRQQRRVVQRRYRDRPGLRRRLEALLACDTSAAEFLERPALGPAGAADEPAPAEPDSPHPDERVIGPWRLVRPIATGGMGSVWLARRSDGSFEQAAAVKLLRDAGGSPHMRQRFDVEKQALAQFDHPNIARLLDGGTAADGTPYLVMELITGIPIDAYCDRHRLSMSERLDLFGTVCRAVHAAHRNLVVHRDLKPDNILVTSDGVPKLVDFGIAKLLEPDGQGAVAPTLTQLMTPDFASPEQVRGEPVTTATDIYSLGVVLYVLLTGERPYHVRGLPPGKVERVVCELDPPRPSTAVVGSGIGAGPGAAEDRQGPTAGDVRRVAADRRLTAEALRRRLRGDLDNIVMMALRKEAERRYSSAAELADDIQRYRSGRPVSARQDTVWYRTRKFVLRNKVPTAIAAVLAVSLVAGAAGIAWEAALAARQRDAARAASAEESRQRRRAEAAEQAARAEAERARLEAQSAQRVSEFLVDVFKVADPNEVTGDTITARQVLDQASQRLKDEPGLEPAVRATLSDAMGRVYLNLGMYEPAERQLDEALELRRTAFGDDDELTRSTLSNLGELHYATGEYDDAQALFEGLVASYESSSDRETPQFAEAVNNLAATRRALGDNEEAGALYERSLQIRRRLLGDDDPAVAESLNNLAAVHMAKGELQRAEAYLREALAVRRTALGAEHPLVAQTTSNLAVVMQRKGDLAAAEPLYRDALEGFRAALGPDHPSVATTASALGSLLQATGRSEEGEAYLREALSIQRRRLGSDHPRVATTLTNLARVLTARGETEGARAAIDEALAIRRATLPAGHPQTAGTLQVYGALLVETGELDAAEPLLREALEIYRAALPADHRFTLRCARDLARCLAGLGRHDEAKALLVRAYETACAARGEQDPDAVQIAADLAKLRARRPR
jgi:serine/threonine protein kinase/tetratricopeptide (TPR) repeat protein